MGTQNIKRPIKQFTDNIKKQLKIDQIILFGSYASGHANKQSDIDIIVISSDFESLREDKRLKILDSASKNIYPEIQAWGFTPQELSAAPTHTTLGTARETGILLS